MDRVVTSEEGVSEKEEILLVRDDSQGTDRTILTLRSIKNIIFRIHNVPKIMEHDLNCTKFTLFCALKGKESVLNLIFFNTELPNKLCSEGCKVTFRN